MVILFQKAFIKHSYDVSEKHLRPFYFLSPGPKSEQVK